MDLVDGPGPSDSESRMRRIGKILVFTMACSVALVLTVRFGSRGISIGAEPQLQAAARSGSHYDLARLPILGATLNYVLQNYFDRNRIEPKRMLLGALDYIQRDVPEVLIDRVPENDPKQVVVKVNGIQKTFAVDRVDAPWTLHTMLKDIFRFVQPNLQPVAEKDEARRLLDIEVAATNGMLSTLDPHSNLLDVESYREMRTQTQGKFGGLGIVIEMDKKNRITVKRPMLDTPAIRAGIKAKDHIVRINNESTMNMTLVEAVDRLRGDVDTTVDVYIERDNAPGVKKFTITRAAIRPPSIDPPPRVLAVPAGPGQAPAKIGYFHLQHFSANTASDLADALQLFERERVKGIIMDLRGNPGGLYDQAQKVADAFIDSGTLVSMVGVGGSQRKDDVATRSEREPKVPVAVLVSQTSASASEIVAGAMKNLDRGVVLGERTFGKGSVQVLFDIGSPVKVGDKSDDDKLGLKLTTAQYLTPNDTSIQGVGVVPDIETDPLFVQKISGRPFVRLEPTRHKRREADQESHLDNPRMAKVDKPLEVVQFLLEPRPSEQKRLQKALDEDAPDDDEAVPEDDSEFHPDFLIEMARDLLAQAKSPRRRELVAQSKAYLDKVRSEQDRKLEQALEKLGVDWSPAPVGAGQTAPTLQLSLVPATGSSKAAAGEIVKLRGVVKNVGQVPAYRVHAMLECDNPVFDETELVFGKIAPGDSKTYDLAVKVPQSSLTRTDVLKATLFAQNGAKAQPADLVMNVEGRQRPLFAYSYQTIDDVKGNRDGQVQRGEQVRLLVTVKNIGAGKAPHTEAVLRNGAGQEGILISAGRFETKELAPGDTKSFSFVYEVRPEYRGDDYQLELMVGDTVLGESVADKVKIRLAPAGVAPEGASGVVTVMAANAALRESPADGALVVGWAPKGSAFKVNGKLGSFSRVEIAAGRTAFLAAADVSHGGGAPKGGFRSEWQVTPPVLTVNAPTSTSGDTVHLKASATDDHLVRDVFIRVINRNAKVPAKKVYYQTNRGERTRFDFETDIPLWPGSNIIQVVARENNDVQTVDTLVVLRKPAGPPVAQPGPVLPPGASK